MKPRSAHLSKLFWFAILSLVAVALFAAACAAPAPAPAAPKAPAAAAPAPTPAPLPTVAAAPSPTASRVASVKITRHPQLGPVLTDSAGRTLYLFTKDELNKSNCSGGCAQNWPPLTTTGAPTAGEGVTASFLGTITRADGTLQVTYNGWPLYYWYKDEKPGDALGQDVGKVWFVLSPDWKAIPAAALAAAPVASTPTPAPLVSTPTPTAVAGSRVNVDISNFTLPNITVSVGTTVVWTNRDSAAHTSTADGGKWRSGLLSTGDSFSYTFTEAGTFSYHCEPHPSMRGTITVIQQATDY